MRGLALILALAACGAPAYPRAPLRPIAGYPLRFALLSPAERAARERAAAAKNPGWSIRLDDLGFLNSAGFGDAAPGEITDADRAVLAAFLARNGDLLGFAGPPPPVELRGARVEIDQPGGRAIVIGRATIEGHFLPGWRAWPAPLPTETLLRRFLGLPATLRTPPCTQADEPERPRDLVGKRPVPPEDPGQAIHLRRADLAVGQQYWYQHPVAGGTAVELRYFVELRVPKGECAEGRARFITADLPAVIDAITGEGFPSL